MILSTLAATSTIQARWARRGRSAATGRVRLSRVRMLTTWPSIAPMSTIGVAPIVATVSLFAASGFPQLRTQGSCPALGILLEN